MNPDRVLFVGREFTEGDLVSAHVRDLAAELAGQGVEPHLVCFDDYHAVEEHGPLTVHRVNFELDGDTLFSWGMLINLPFIRRIRELFDEGDFDLVHGHNWESIPATVTVSEVFGTPAVLSMHALEGENHDRPKHAAIHTVEVDGIRSADAVVVPREEVRARIEDYDTGTEVTVADSADAVVETYGGIAEVHDDHEDPDAYVGVPSE